MVGKLNWSTKRLGDLAEFRNGVNYNKSSFGKGVKVVGVSNFQDYTKPRYEELEQINPEGIVTERNILRDGDIVFVRSNGNRELIGRSLLIEKPPEEVTHSAFTIRLRFTSRDAHPKFYAYCFRTPQIRQALTAQGGGTNINNLNQNILQALEVPLPPLPCQQRIASILSTYDELIENCQRRIKILESMARALYREWFVHFRFPGHENHPRVTSSFGEIPKGWEVTNLEMIKAEQPYAINGGPFGSKLGTRDYVETGVPVIRGSNLSESGRFDDTSFVFVSDAKAKELQANQATVGDIVVTQRGTLGQIGMIPSGTGYDRFVISQSQMKITLNPAKVNREYIFFFLRSDEATQRIKNLASSSGVPHINLAVLREFNVLLPPFELQSSFGKLAGSTESAIETLRRQIKNLRRTRDLLLPRLLSGQIAIEALAPPLESKLYSLFANSE